MPRTRAILWHGGRSVLKFFAKLSFKKAEKRGMMKVLQISLAFSLEKDYDESSE
jgi:hypothetical protein